MGQDTNDNTNLNEVCAMGILLGDVDGGPAMPLLLMEA